MTISRFSANEVTPQRKRRAEKILSVVGLLSGFWKSAVREIRSPVHGDHPITRFPN
jgi:hypothetical protein